MCRSASRCYSGLSVKGMPRLKFSFWVAQVPDAHSFIPHPRYHSKQSPCPPTPCLHLFISCLDFSPCCSPHLILRPSLYSNWWVPHLRPGSLGLATPTFLLTDLLVFPAIRVDLCLRPKCHHRSWACRHPKLSIFSRIVCSSCIRFCKYTEIDLWEGEESVP